MKEKTDRNNRIVEDKEAGMSWTKLMRKYGLSYASINRILKRRGII